MAHLKHGAEHKAEATPREWLPVGKQVADLANLWSERADIVGYVGPGAGGPAPACFIPATAEVEVNVDVAFGFGVKPSDIDLTTRSGRYEFPKAIGAIAHEAFHAKHSSWSLPDAMETLARDEYEALTLLEESRIEFRGVTANPRLRPFLRSCAMEIVVTDAAESFAGQSNTVQAATLVGLVYARVDAGIIPLRDVADVTDLVDDYLGLDRVAALRELAIAAQEWDESDDPIEGLYDIAREWARIVREICDEKGDPKPGEAGAGEAGGEAGEGGSGGTLSEFGKALMDALGDAAEAAEIGAGAALEAAESKERDEDVVKERKDAAKEIGDAKAAMGKVFGKGTGSLYGRGTGSTMVKERPPTSDERVAAVKVARMLEKAKYRERGSVDIHSEMPPGRLRSRAIVQREAMKARGVRSRVEPFERTVRKHTDQPDLSVGVIVDISGSMGKAMEPMATTAYVMGEAAHRVQARCAMVYYGNACFPTLRAGERRDKVQVWTAPDGTEKFDEAFRAIDGALDLLHGDGARLLVVVSDGCYTPDETKKAKAWMQRCKAEGVAVVWLPFDDGYHSGEITKHHGTLLTGMLKPTAAAMQIGQACAEALTAMGARV